MVYKCLLEPRVLDIFKSTLTLSIKIYKNKYLIRLETFSVKGSTSKRFGLVNNPCLTAIYYPIKCKDDMYLYVKTGFKAADSISFSNGNPSYVLNLKQKLIRIKE